MDENVGAPDCQRLRIVGAGAYIGPHVVTNADIARAIPGWSAEKIEEKTGLTERRYLWPLDIERGCARAIESDEAREITTATDMAEIALREALEMAGMSASELDMLIVVTCTPDQPRFSHDAMTLHRRLGGRKDTHCIVVDSGCGGSLYVLDMLNRMMTTSGIRSAAVVGTNLSSPLVDRDVYTNSGMKGADGEDVRAYLSTYVFGDGAGAIVVRRDSGARGGIRSSLAGSEHWELVRSPGGGTESPPYGDRYSAADHAFIVNGRLVAQTYMKTMRECVATVTREAGCGLSDIDRFYLHQPNGRMLRSLAEALELRPDQVASNVDRVGNTSSAGMFILLAEDLRRERIALGRGATVLFAAIGAGVHYGAQVVEL
jgi:3-oxoacyl-[acyl-carrier-protein] synthase-3